MIQKRVGTEWRNTDVECTFESMVEILKARVAEGLEPKPVVGWFNRVKSLKLEWTKEEIVAALERAGQFFMDEFKKRTASIA